MCNRIKFLLGILVLVLFGCNRNFTKEFNQNIKDLNSFQTFTEVEKTPKLLEHATAIRHKHCKKADIHFKDLSFKHLPILLTKIYGTQINVNQDYDLQITINHLDICLEELLDELGDLYNIGYSKNNFGYNLNVKALKTKFFTIHYHNFKRTGNSTTSVQGGSSLSGDSGSNGQANIQTQIEDNFWSDVSQNISMLIGTNIPQSFNNAPMQGGASGEDEPNFSIYKESGIIVVNAYPKAMKNVEKFINRVNKMCSKQVSIEAKILEVTLSDEFSTGIDWSILKQGMTFSTEVNNLRSELDIPSSNLIIKATKHGNFNSTIKALSSQGKVSVLSSPKISVLNNQKAVFKFGEDKYHITGVSSSTSSTNNAAAATTNAVATPTLTALFSGISLDATPTITRNNQIIMHIHPTITTIDVEERDFQLSGQNYSKFPLASIDTREADTVVKAFDGDIIVVGGLMQNTVNLVKSGLPTKLNFLQRLFGTRREYVEKKELVLLLRPVIVESVKPHYDFSRYLIEEEDEDRPSITEFQEE